MKIYSIDDKEFIAYGREVKADFKALLSRLGKTECPQDGTVYEPSCADLEALDVSKQLRIECFGGLPIQIGYCNGHNNVLNCLEYHKSSEINIAESDAVLLLGKQQDIVEGKYDTAKVRAFLVPAGRAVELYATTLHYAPCGLNGGGFRVAVVLPQGTNYAKPKDAKCPMLWGSNKWLIAHPESTEAKNGAYVGLVGENIRL